MQKIEALHVENDHLETLLPVFEDQTENHQQIDIYT